MQQLSERRRELSRAIINTPDDRTAARALVELEELAIREEQERAQKEGPGDGWAQRQGEA